MLYLGLSCTDLHITKVEYSCFLNQHDTSFLSLCLFYIFIVLRYGRMSGECKILSND